ncbi:MULTISPECIES: MOSC domain-containing protein [unclassified Nocardioides]|uniref:MOSC domain-containing protein n=1 Tax=unclassified Nocardioides TaxID=2615069 RepID=UPI000AED8064|nr:MULTISPECIES: MOSC domain-containing protein [unclassified Nocardioides]
MEGTVIALYVAAEHHAAMEPRESIQVEAGSGIVGDRYHGSRHRHVTVQSAADLDAAAADLGAPVTPPMTRRNVTVDVPVPTEPGARIVVGEVLLEAVRIAAPCRIMETSIGPGGRVALRRRGGTAFRALSSGTIRVGDPVRPG